MTLWIVFGIMLLAATLTTAWPMYRHHGRLSAVAAASVLGVVGLSVVVYSELGAPNVSSGLSPEQGSERVSEQMSDQSAAASINAMVASLDARLQENPDDLDGWKMLGRSYMQLRQLPRAVAAYEKAVALEASGNAETLVSLGEAMFVRDQSSIQGRAGHLFENALALAPHNPGALFYGGLTAAQRGDTAQAADRWEALLAVGPPPGIEETLRQRVAEWRGESGATVRSAAASADNAATVVSIDIGIGSLAAASIDPSSTVFIIARDPARPSPPLAVARRQANQLPDTVELSDSDAMVPGRIPSKYDELEIIVRVSRSGQPIAQTGDWFGQGLMRPAQGPSIAITVDQQVP